MYKAIIVKVHAVLTPGITDQKPAARANRQLCMDASHGRVVRLDGLDLAFPPASQTDAGAARLETLAGGGHEQRHAIRALLGLPGTLLKARMLRQRGFELCHNRPYAIFRAGFAETDHVALFQGSRRDQAVAVRICAAFAPKISE